VELEPGLDRVSGAWHEQAAGPEDDSWRPSWRTGESGGPPPGELVSGIDRAAEAIPPGLARAQQALDRLGIDIDIVSRPQLYDDYEQDDELEPQDVLLDAYEMGDLVELSYAAAGGTLVERVKVEELGDARFLVEDPETGTRRWRWLKGVRSVRLIES